MSVWAATCRLLAKHLGSGERLDVLLETLPRQLPADEQKRCRHLLFGTVRHFGLLDSVLSEYLAKRPRAMLRAVLLTGGFDLLEHPDDGPVIVHHWVGVARQLTSAGEAKLVNAVLCRMPAGLAAVVGDKSCEPAALARRFSHPEWLVRRWADRFGVRETVELLEWNQQPAPVHARVVPGGETDPALPWFFQPTTFPGFFRLERLDWSVVEPMLAAGRIYLQDPATAVAPRMLAVAAGENVLDVCAAPGGKTFQLAEAAGPEGRVVAVDLKGARLERLRRNLSARPQHPVAVLGGDATTLSKNDLVAANLPVAYDAVLVDAPCSNTGMLRHRVDVKRRLRPADVEGLARLQLTILKQVSAFVRAGGRVVYSTCSLEKEENEDVVAVFVDGSGGDFALEQSEQVRPWRNGCDGAGVFLLRRMA